MQLAKKAGTNPRAFADLVAERLRAADGISEVEVAGPGFLNVTRRGGRPGPGRGRHRRGRVRRTAAPRTLAGPEDQPRVRLRQPHRPPAPRRHPLGGRRRRARAGAPGLPGAEVTREYYFNDHGAQIDRFGASLSRGRAGRAVPEDGYGGDYIKEIADAGRRHAPRRPRPARRRGAGGLPRGRGVEPDVRRRSSRRCTTSGSTSTSTSTSTTCTTSGAVETAIERLTEMGNTSPRPTARSGCAPSKYGDDKDRVHRPVQRQARLLLRRPRPTTSTSASAGSTAASSCSAPTTTATSAG